MTITNPQYRYLFTADPSKLLGGTFAIKKSEDENAIVAVEEDTGKIHIIAMLYEEIDPSIAMNNHIISDMVPEYPKETFIPKPYKHRYLGLVRRAGKMTPKEK